jgi:two-component system, NtrC family, sensor kinase
MMMKLFGKTLPSSQPTSTLVESAVSSQALQDVFGPELEAWIRLVERSQHATALLTAEGELVAHSAGFRAWEVETMMPRVGTLPHAETPPPPFQTFLQQQLLPWPVRWRAVQQQRLSPVEWRLQPLTPTPFWLMERVEASQWQRMQQLKVLAEAVNSSLNQQDIFMNLAERLQEYLPYTYLRLGVLDESHNRINLWFSIDQNLDEDEVSFDDKGFVGDDALMNRLRERPTPYCLKVSPETPSKLYPADAQGFVLTGALWNKGFVVGFMALYRDELDYPLGFQPEEIERFADCTVQLAVALENARNYIQIQQQNEHSFLVNQITRSISQSLDADTILETAVSKLGRVTGVTRCYVQYFDTPLDNHALLDSEEVACSGKVFIYQQPDVNTLTLPVVPQTLSFPQVEWRAFSLRRPSVPTGSKKSHLLNPFVIDDTHQDPILERLGLQGYLQENQIRSLAIFPLQIPGLLLGVLTLHQCDKPRSWLKDDQQLFSSIAEHLSLALKQARLFQEVLTQKEERDAALTELQQTQMQLIQSEKMAVIGQFVAGIAHEVNTPLGSMMSNTETLNSALKRMKIQAEPLAQELQMVSGPSKKLELPPVFRPDRLQQMEELLSINLLAGNRIRDIVRNLRNFARLDESEMKSVDLHEGLDSTLLLIQSSMPVHMRIEKHYDQDFPLVHCYPGLLNQVFMNMMVNAIHATQGVATPTLTLGTSRVEGNPNLVQVMISDNGRGIPAENLKRIFDPGFTTKSAGVGTGLGLALCHKIIYEKHRGRIEVSSSPGEGTLFVITLPINYLLDPSRQLSS